MINPYVVAVGVVLGCFMFWFTNEVAEQKTVLRPDIFQEFELKEKTIISHNVARYRFHLPTTDAVLGLPIGQHMSVGAFIRQPDGSVKEIVRSYTPLTGDEVRGYFELLVKSYPQGNISQHFASLKIGQRIRVRGPKGAFMYSPNMVRRFGMIAGGTGITPMMQVMRAIQRGRCNGDKTEVDLIFANVTAEDILLKEDLDALALQDPCIHVHYVLNQAPTGWKGGIGFVTPEMMKMWLPEPARDIKILFCGPPPMVAAMKKAAVSLGFEKARLVSKLEDQVFVF
ncbi:nitrate reductase [Ilyonectria robusta]|uniref:nitrate reductase n=1 Tax=Ilyonectria robusta TaxID=1079257 RepID=UPI001E8D8EA0|nr:nitrate reductase [Ilyonectria robusta]KAH8683571.1 nitrate reductase [Ilyonectria robusta]